METVAFQLRDLTLNSADAGLSLASQVLAALAESPMVMVSVDFAGVDRMTPSFANAFVMTLLHAMSLDTLKERVVLVDRNDHVTAAVSDSVRRYHRGIRLSSQRDELTPA